MLAANRPRLTAARRASAFVGDFEAGRQLEAPGLEHLHRVDELRLALALELAQAARHAHVGDDAFVHVQVAVEQHLLAAAQRGGGENAPRLGGGAARRGHAVHRPVGEDGEVARVLLAAGAAGEGLAPRGLVVQLGDGAAGHAGDVLELRLLVRADGGVAVDLAPGLAGPPGRRRSSRASARCG